MASTPQTLEVPGYQVMQFLGSGARSTIWQIRNRRDGELYALKRVVRRHAADYRFLEQAINEYRVALNFTHPVVRRIYNMRRVKRWLALREIHLVMEMCQGHTVQDRRPKSVAEVVRIFISVADGLAYMNARGYIHADTKPNNIIVAPDGAVKIIDLGQSCPSGTLKQRIQGTPDFIAPEQVRRQPINAQTDVFNFGAALYWTLTGRPIPTVLPKKTGMTFINDLVIVPAEKINPQVPSSLSKLVKDCVEIQPSRRPQSLDEVGTRLAAIAHALNRSDGS